MISHPATESDLRAVARLVADIHGAADSGAALLNQLTGPATAFAARPFRSGSVRGEWVAAPGSSGDGVLLYLHSRRFQFDEPAGVYAARLAAATRLPVLHLHYRLAPENPYPAALDDVLEAYQALLAQGTPASRIVIAGHSAGATLALSALLALRDRGRPMPAAAVAISPITDFTLSGASLAGDCTGLPPLLIACGDAEMLRDDAVRFADRALAAGVPVELEVFEGMPHGFPVLSLDASQVLLSRVAAFIAARLGETRTSR